MSATFQAEALGQAMSQLWHIWGVDRCPHFYRDLQFLWALGAAVPCWMLVSYIRPLSPLSWSSLWTLAFISLVLWLPVLEELLFRGLLQGQLRRLAWGRRGIGPITMANAITSVLFVMSHLYSHPLGWTASILLPAFVFGYMRDRFQSIYPSTALHIVYNAGYFILIGLPPGGINTTL
jgi:CAAX protease family protein